MVDPAQKAAGIWQQVLCDLPQQMPRATFELHFPRSRALAWDPESNAWTIGVRSPSSLDWLRYRLAPVVGRNLARHTVGLPAPQITFVVASPPASRSGPDVSLEGARAAETGQPGARPDDPCAPSGQDDGARRMGSDPARTKPVRAEGIASPSARDGEDFAGTKPVRDQKGTPPTTRDRDDHAGTTPLRDQVDSSPREREREELAGTRPMRDQEPSSQTPAAPLSPNEIYIRIKTAMRKECLRRLRGARLSVFLCLALHVDRDGISRPGVNRIVAETGYGRTTVCQALADLCAPGMGLVEKLPTPMYSVDRYRILGYAWYGANPVPALYEEASHPQPAGSQGL